MFAWPGFPRKRIPYGFDGEIYKWLNPDVAKAGIDPYKHYLEIGHQEKRNYIYHKPLLLNQLANRHKSDKGDYYFNRHFYSRVYEHYLKQFQTHSISILEIGLLRHDIQEAHAGDRYYDAPSLKIWRD